jgi:hypothetical protein
VSWHLALWIIAMFTFGAVFIGCVVVSAYMSKDWTSEDDEENQWP